LLINAAILLAQSLQYAAKLHENNTLNGIPEGMGEE
jgi:hypothetical protein